MDRKVLIETLDKRHGKYLFRAMDTRQDAPVQESLTEAKGNNLDSSKRQSVNSAIGSVVKNKLWDKPYSALNKIESDVLKRHGLTIEGSRSADMFIGDSGTRRFTVSRDGKELDNTVLAYQWGKSGDKGSYDAVCYLS